MGNLRKPHLREEALPGRVDHRRQFSKVGSSPPTSALPDLMTPNQPLLKFRTDFASGEKSNLPRENGAY